MVEVMDGLNSMPWMSLGRLPNGWSAEVTPIPRRSKFKYGYDLWSNGLAFEAFAIGRTYKASIRAPGYGDGMWLFNFDTNGRAVNASYTGTYWGDFETMVPDSQPDFRLLPYPRHRPEMHRLIGGTWLRAKWMDRFDDSHLTYRAEILDDGDAFYLAAMEALDEFVSLVRTEDSLGMDRETEELVETLRRLPLKTHAELKGEQKRFHDILQIGGEIPVEPPELALDHYHAIPVKVQDGCGGPCTFCTLYDRRIHVLPVNDVFRQIDLMAEYLGEELDHFRKVVLLQGDALAIPSSHLIEELGYAREKFELSSAPFAHAFSKASTVAKKPLAELRDLRRAGLLNVNFGLESGCQELLDTVKRGQRLVEFREAVLKLHEVGIDVSINVIAGLGGAKFKEKHERETIEFLGALPKGIKVFYSPLQVFADSYYAKKQNDTFGGSLSEVDLTRQQESFERSLGAYKYLFVPM